MVRRAIAIITAALLGAALLPALPAAANNHLAATATLTEGLEIFPGSAQSFAFQVRNTSSAPPGQDFIDSIVDPEDPEDRSLNWVEIMFPADFGITVSGDGISAPPGWDWLVDAEPGDSFQSVTFFGGRLERNTNANFTVGGDVAAPFSRDVIGRFSVFASRDGGQTTTRADVASGGTLDSIIRILEVIDVTASAPVDANGNPIGDVEARATEGQTVDVDATVLNHARSSVTVSGQPIVPAQDTAGPVSPSSQSISSGGTGDYSFQVTFGGVSTNDRNATIRLQATATNATSPNTPGSRTIVTVEREPLLSLTNFSPKAVTDGPRVFTVDATKQRLPALTLFTGELCIAGLCAGLDPASDDFFARGANTTGDLRFFPIDIALDEGEYDAVFTFTGIDDNGKPFSQTVTLVNALIVDLTNPVVNIDLVLPEDADGDRQIRAKNDDLLSISGDVENAGPSALRQEVRVFIEIEGQEPDEIEDVQVTVQSNSRLTFSANVEYSFGDDDDGVFFVWAEGRDEASNTGAGASDDFEFDNFVPDVAGEGFTRKDLAGEVVRDEWPIKTYVEFVFDENFLIRGGCDPNMYRVDGQPIVAFVLYTNGELCGVDPDSGDFIPGAKGPDNSRVLLLTQEIDIDSEPWAEYNPDVYDVLEDSPLALETGPLELLQQRLDAMGDQVKDGAGHFAAFGLQDLRSSIVPPLPTIIEVQRNTGGDDEEEFERATFDEGRHWTRFGGGDDLLVTVGGARSQWHVEAVDEDGNILNQVVVDDPNDRECTVDLAGEQRDCRPTGQAQIRVPIGSVDGTYVRGIRLSNRNEVPGPVEQLLIELDTELPLIDRIDLGADGEVTVSFTEPAPGGTNFADSWVAFELTETEDGSTGRLNYRPERVSGSGSSRVLEVDFPGFGEFGGVEYRFRATGSAKRYVDRAGNPLDDQVFEVDGP